MLPSFLCLAVHSFTLNVLWKVKVSVTQSCLTCCDPMDCSPPASSVHGIIQARILERVAVSFSRRSSLPRDQTGVSCIAGTFFTIWATREPQICYIHKSKSPSENATAHTDHKQRTKAKAGFNLVNDILQYSVPHFFKALRLEIPLWISNLLVENMVVSREKFIG